MKSLKGIMIEGIFSDVDTVLVDGDTYLMVDMLFNDDATCRQVAIEDLKKLVESYKPKQIKWMAKLKNYNGYFIEFSINEPGTGKIHKTKYDAILVTNKQNTNCYNLDVYGWYTKVPYWFNCWSWKLTKTEYRPKQNLVYEVPRELTALFDAIFEKHDNRLLGF
jgi:hypothetical protein